MHGNKHGGYLLVSSMNMAYGIISGEVFCNSHEKWLGSQIQVVKWLLFPTSIAVILTWDMQ